MMLMIMMESLFSWSSSLVLLMQIPGQRMDIVGLAMDTLFVHPGSLMETQRLVWVLHGLFVFDNRHWKTSN